MSLNARPDDHRRKWDRDEYSNLAKERRSKDNEKLIEKTGSPVKRELLKARDFKVDLTSKLGKTQIINKTSGGSQLGGYFCELCECVVKDSVSYLDHINGKNHQRNLGMSMKVERSTLDQVKNRFAMHKQNKEKEQKATKPFSLEERVNELKEKEERQKAHKRERKAQKREAPPDDEQDKNDDFSKLMGFASFSSKKLKY